jgi:hypothetical protein
MRSRLRLTGPRRSADVVCAFRHCRYKQNGSFYQGITFEKLDGTRIHNFREYHSRNLTGKQQHAGNRFKPAIRVLKNLRSNLIEAGRPQKGDAPSYFLERLLYNVSDEHFAGSIAATVFNMLTWLYYARDRSNFVCANERYYLLRDASSACWPTANGFKFLDAAIALWNGW